MPYPDIEISRKDLSLATVHAGIVATASVVTSLGPLYWDKFSDPFPWIAKAIVVGTVIYVYIRTGIPGINQEGNGSYRVRSSTMNMYEIMWFLFVYPLLYMFWVVLTFYISGLFLSRLTLLQSLPDGGGTLTLFLLAPLTGGWLYFVMFPLTGIFWCAVFSVAHGVGLLTNRWVIPW